MIRGTYRNGIQGVFFVQKFPEIGIKPGIRESFDGIYRLFGIYVAKGNDPVLAIVPCVSNITVPFATCSNGSYYQLIRWRCIARAPQNMPGYQKKSGTGYGTGFEEISSVFFVGHIVCI